MALFREHRGGLNESMLTVVTVGNLAELIAHLKTLHGIRSAAQVTIKHYGYDPRIMWDNYIVCINGEAVGFTNELLR